MDLKHLDYFREIVDCEYNLSRAAKKLHITQPSLSMMINSLEAEYNIKLFIKEKGRYTGLTSDGIKIYKHAKFVLTIHNDFLFNLQESDTLINGVVRIGIPPLIISLILNKCIMAFNSEHKNIKLEIIEHGANELEAMLLKNEIDLAIIVEPVESNLFNKHLIYRDRLVAICHKNSELANEKVATPNSLCSQDIVLLDETFRIHDTIINFLKTSNRIYNISMKTSQWDWLLDLVDDNQATTILPHVVYKKFSKNHLIKELSTPLPWEVIVISKKNKIKTPAMKFLEEYITAFYSKPFE